VAEQDLLGQLAFPWGEPGCRSLLQGVSTQAAATALD